MMAIIILNFFCFFQGERLDFFFVFVTFQKKVFTYTIKELLLVCVHHEGISVNFFNFDFKKLVILTLMLILPLMSINMQQTPGEGQWFTKPFTFISGSFQQFFYQFSGGVKETTSMYLNLINIKKESQDLKSTHRELISRLDSMTEMQRENDRLRSLLQFKQKSKMDLVAARVMGRDIMTDHASIRINKGLNHGLKAGQAVITTGGVVGYIYQPDTLTSKVLLITDRYAVVDGIVQRSRARGIVEGKNQNGCVLQYVERSEDVVPGDIVITSGIDNIFPKGFPVAVVESVENKTTSVSVKVELKPLVDPLKVEEVFVILNAANEDYTEALFGTPANHSNLSTPASGDVKK